MKLTLCFFLTVLLFGCSNSEKKSDIEISGMKGDPKAIQLVNANFDSLLNHCSGLNEYQEDLLFAGINDLLGPELGEMSRVEVKFEVVQYPKNIPSDFRASGHTCGYGISDDGKSLRIQKDVCVSVCLGNKYKGSTDYVANL